MSMTATAQSVLPPQGGEFLLVGRLPADQVHPQVALDAGGGYVVWEENSGPNGALLVLGAPLGPGFICQDASAIMPISLGVGGESQNARLATLANGGRVVVWQGGASGAQHIFARFLTADHAFASEPIQISAYAANQQIDPTVAVLKDGTVFVAWTNLGQDGDMAGVFARRLSPAGEFLGPEFQINQVTAYNQRSASASALSGGGVAVAWVSEQQRGPRSVDLYARLLNAAGEAVSREFLLNSTTNLCANPALAASADGGFTVVWSQQDLGAAANSWDIYGSRFSAQGAPVSSAARLNTYTYGDQFAPSIASVGEQQLAVWTSLLQDGSWEGVFGRVLSAQGRPEGAEIQVNTTTLSRQIHPAVAANNAGQALAVWSSFGTGANSFDLAGQLFGAPNTIQARLSLVPQGQGWVLEWTTQPGSSYQVQVSSNFEWWTNVGAARPATGTTDSVTLTPTEGAAYYRVVVLP